MAFVPSQTRTPSAIGALNFQGVDNPAGEPDQLLYEIQVLDQFGDVIEVKEGNLAPHVDGTAPVSVAELTAFATWLRAKAVDEILG
jgi:hypothetical protein